MLVFKEILKKKKKKKKPQATETYFLMYFDSIELPSCL